MWKLPARQMWLCILVMALFAPVFLSIGSPRFRPSWLSATIGWIPVTVLGTLVLMSVFVCLTWIFSKVAFDTTDDDGGAQ